MCALQECVQVSSALPVGCTAQLTHVYSSFVLKQVFSGENSEAAVEKIHEYLVSLSNDVRAGLIPLDDFIIYKVNPFLVYALSVTRELTSRRGL